jgi:hypothetical protein
MKNNLVVPWIIEVLMIAPTGNRPVNLNVTMIRGPANANHRISKIRTAVSIELPHIKNMHRLILGCLERHLLDILPAPDVTEKSLVNIECVLAHGVSHEAGYVLQSRDG